MSDSNGGNTKVDNKILVAYANKCGSTAQVAQAIGQALGNRGATVEVKPVKAVTSVEGYRAVVVGSAIWLWQHKPWGYVLAAMANVKGAVYMLGLCTATLTAYRAGTRQSLSEIGLWGSIGIGCLITSIVLLVNLKGGAPLD